MLTMVQYEKKLNPSIHSEAALTITENIRFTDTKKAREWIDLMLSYDKNRTYFNFKILNQEDSGNANS